MRLSRLPRAPKLKALSNIEGNAPKLIPFFSKYPPTMKTVYRTKVSITLILIISLIMGCILILLAVSSKWIPFFIDLLLYASILYLMVSIKYEINELQLIIHQAMGKMTIDINTIKSIEPTHTILSAPASSLDRLRISYNKYDDVVISPRRTEEFIQHLLSINPQIELVEKK